RDAHGFLIGNARGHFAATAAYLLLLLFLGNLLAAALQLDLELIERFARGSDFAPHTGQLRRTRNFIVQLALEVVEGLLPGLFPIFEHLQANLKSAWEK